MKSSKPTREKLSVLVKQDLGGELKRGGKIRTVLHYIPKQQISASAEFNQRKPVGVRSGKNLFPVYDLPVMKNHFEPIPCLIRSFS